MREEEFAALVSSLGSDLTALAENLGPQHQSDLPLDSALHRPFRCVRHSSRSALHRFTSCNYLQFQGGGTAIYQRSSTSTWFHDMHRELGIIAFSDSVVWHAKNSADRISVFENDHNIGALSVRSRNNIELSDAGGHDFARLRIDPWWKFRLGPRAGYLWLNTSNERLPVAADCSATDSCTEEIGYRLATLDRTQQILFFIAALWRTTR